MKPFGDTAHELKKLSGDDIGLPRVQGIYWPVDPEPGDIGNASQPVRHPRWHLPVVEYSRVRTCYDVDQQFLNRVAGRVSVEFSPIALVLEDRIPHAHNKRVVDVAASGLVSPRAFSVVRRL